MPVGELLRRVSSKELIGWKLFLSEEPAGFEMENWRFAMLASVFSNSFRSKKSRKTKVADFMPKIKKRVSANNSLIEKMHVEGTPEIYGDPL